MNLENCKKIRASKNPFWCRPYANCSKLKYYGMEPTSVFLPKISYGNIIHPLFLKAYETYPTKKFFTILRILFSNISAKPLVKISI